MRRIGSAALASIFSLLCWSPISAQTNGQTSAELTAAYESFQTGRVHTAIKQIEDILASGRGMLPADKAARTRDLIEMCATANEWECASKRLRDLPTLVGKDPSNVWLLADAWSFEAQFQRWSRNDSYFETIIQSGKGPSPINSAAFPVSSARLSLALSSHLVGRDRYSEADEAVSAAFAALLLTDDRNRRGIAKQLVDLIEARFEMGDILGAIDLADDAEGYILTTVPHDSVLYAHYKLITGHLLTYTNSYDLCASVFLEAAQLYSRLEISEDGKTYHLTAAHSLASTALLLAGQLEQAEQAHKSHPLYSRKGQIQAKSSFESYAEFYFALSDILISSSAQPLPDIAWKPVFAGALQLPGNSKEIKENTAYVAFARALLGIGDASNKVQSQRLAVAAANGRVKALEASRINNFDGSQLPNIIDKIIITIGLTAASHLDDQDYTEFLVRGGQVLTRDTRDNLSRIAFVLSSQPDESSRRNVHSYFHVVQQKKEWERKSIRAKLSGGRQVADNGNIVPQYGAAVEQLSRIRKQILTSSSPRMTTIASLQAGLKAGQAVVTFFPLAEGIGRVCITPKEILKATSSVDPKIAEDFERIKVAVSGTTETLPEYPFDAAVRAYDFLFGGIQNCVLPGTSLTIVAGDPVSAIPVGALLKNKPRHSSSGVDLTAVEWLIKSIDITVVSSLEQYFATADGVRPTAHRSYLGVGNPKFDDVKVRSAAATRGAFKTSLGTIELTSLPETDDEVRAVSKRYKAADILLSSEATEANLRSRPLGDYDVLHFATHGLMRDDLAGLEDSALVLTAENPADPFDDGLLTASEISRLRLNSRIVVLSACNTAKYYRRGASRGVHDLQAAFTVAGAPTMLASLWPVESSAAKTLIIGFFNHWSGSGATTTSRALALSTRDFLSKADRRSQHPAVWGAFTVIGQGQVSGSESQDSEGGEPFLSSMNGFSNGGDVLSVKELGEDLAVSMSTDWDGKKMNGIVARRTVDGSEKWRVSSREIGIGEVVVLGVKVYVAGYTTEELSVPVIRAFDSLGSPLWERRYPELRGHQLSGMVASEDGMVAVAVPQVTKSKDVFLISVSKSGLRSSVARIADFPDGLRLGTVATLWGSDGQTFLLLNKGAETKIRPDRQTLIGVPDLCQQGVEATLYEVNVREGVLKPISVLPNFRASKMTKTGASLLIAGESLAECHLQGVAAVMSVSGSKPPEMFWKDDDLFESAAKGISATESGVLIAVDHRRKLGIEPRRYSEFVAGDKRWGEDPASTREASLVSLSMNGKQTDRRYFAAGFGLYLEGLLQTKSNTIVYGSLLLGGTASQEGNPSDDNFQREVAWSIAKTLGAAFA